MSKENIEDLLTEVVDGVTYVILPGPSADTDIRVSMKEYQEKGRQKIYQEYTPSWQR